MTLTPRPRASLRAPSGRRRSGSQAEGARNTLPRNEGPAQRRGWLFILATRGSGRNPRQALSGLLGICQANVPRSIFGGAPLNSMGHHRDVMGSIRISGGVQGRLPEARGRLVRHFGEWPLVQAVAHAAGIDRGGTDQNGAGVRVVAERSA